ncbi:MAG: hypothetical protein O2930_07370 [Acidobacteria bacterium]|nr:hypothetical protein [Acidobacteriota bacterium]
MADPFLAIVGVWVGLRPLPCVAACAFGFNRQEHRSKVTWVVSGTCQQRCPEMISLEFCPGGVIQEVGADTEASTECEDVAICARYGGADGPAGDGTNLKPFAAGHLSGAMSQGDMSDLVSEHSSEFAL